MPAKNLLTIAEEFSHGNPNRQFAMLVVNQNPTLQALSQAQVEIAVKEWNLHHSTQRVDVNFVIDNLRDLGMEVTEKNEAQTNKIPQNILSRAQDTVDEILKLLQFQASQANKNSVVRQYGRPIDKLIGDQDINLIVQEIHDKAVTTGNTDLHAVADALADRFESRTKSLAA